MSEADWILSWPQWQLLVPPSLSLYRPETRLSGGMMPQRTYKWWSWQCPLRLVFRLLQWGRKPAMRTWWTELDRQATTPITVEVGAWGIPHMAGFRKLKQEIGLYWTETLYCQAFYKSCNRRILPNLVFRTSKCFCLVNTSFIYEHLLWWAKLCVQCDFSKHSGMFILGNSHPLTVTLHLLWNQ